MSDSNKKLLKDAFLIMVVGLSVIYGLYWIGKTVSYKVFYEDMVQETIKEEILPKCLK